MKQLLIKEDKLPPRLRVLFSPELRMQKTAIERYNQNNQNGVKEWKKYIDWMKRYISNPAIAWDTLGKYTHLSNGITLIDDFNINAAFIIKNNEALNLTYVYVFYINLNPEEYGLEKPPLLEQKRRSFYMKESNLRRIIREALIKTLYS